jgi:hypothetical protein
MKLSKENKELHIKKEKAISLAREAEQAFARNDFGAALEKLRELQRVVTPEGSVGFTTEEVTNDNLADPDPFSIFLAIAGFLGSVASIASYIEFKRHEKQQASEARLKLVREAKDLIMVLEVDTMQIEVSLRKLEFVLIEGTGEYQALPLTKLKFEFGTCKPIFTLLGFNKYDEIFMELNRLVGKSFETTSKLLQKLYNLEIKFEPDLYEKLIGLQGKLNASLKTDMTYQEGFPVYYELIVFTKDLLGRIRNRMLSELTGEERSYIS